MGATQRAALSENGLGVVGGVCVLTRTWRYSSGLCAHLEPYIQTAPVPTVLLAPPFAHFTLVSLVLILSFMHVIFSSGMWGRLTQSHHTSTKTLLSFSTVVPPPTPNSKPPLSYPQKE